MTTVLLVRHATCDAVGRTLAGRAPGHSLNDEGRAQAAQLARALESTRLDAIISSPLERATETARAIAAARDVDIEQCAALTEVDFGRWTGCTIESLRGDPVFHDWNAYRTRTRIPEGEHIIDVQRRCVGAIEELRARHASSDARVLVVSHAEPLRTIVAWHLGIALDLAGRLELAPASVSALSLAVDYVSVSLLGWTATATTLGP